MRPSSPIQSGLLALSLVALACGGAKKAPTPASSALSQPAKKAKRGHVVGSFSSGAFGPRLTLGGRDRVVFWLSLDGGQGELFTAPLSAGGSLGQTQSLLEAPPKPTFLAPGTPLGSDFVILLGAQEKDGSSLETIVVSSEGELVRADRDFATGTRIDWAGATADEDRAVVFWSDRRELGTRLSARILERGGPSDPRALSESALVWQARSSSGGGCIAFVEDQGDDLELVIVRVGEGPPERITLARLSGYVDELDLVLHEEGGDIVYTERDSVTNMARLFHLALARDLSPAGAPEPLTPRRGNQRLRALLVDKTRASVRVAWEEEILTPRSGARTYVGRFDEEGSLVTLGLLDSPVADPVLPEFALRQGKLIALARTRSAQAKGKVASELALFEVGPDGPMALPISVPGIPEPATLAWDLSCSEENCRFLAARPAKNLFTTFWVEPGGTSEPTNSVVVGAAALAPIIANERILAVPSLTTFEVTRLPADDETTPSDELLLSLTYFDPRAPIVPLKKPASDGKMVPEQAHLAVARVGGLDTPLLGPSVDPEKPISVRARSPGSTSLSRFEDGKALVGWAALDQGKPHVFLTLIDQSGKKVRQLMLTKDGAEVGDVTVSRTADGFVVLWIDERNGTPEVYGVLLDKELRPTSPEMRLTEGAIEPCDLVIEVTKEEILFAFSARVDESRFSVGAGLFLGALDPKSGDLKAPPTLIRRSSRHAFSPRLLGTYGLGWLEAPTDREDDADMRARALVAKIDRRGMRLLAPRDLGVPGNAAGLSVDCDADRCRLIVVTKDPGQQRVLSSQVSRESLQAGEPLTMRDMFSIPHLLHEGAAPILIGDAFYYATTSERDGPTIWRAEMRSPAESR